MAEPASVPAAGHRSFELKECLGTGGFGDVYLAVMNSPGGIRRQVAVKILQQGLDPTSQAVARLRDEGRILAQLDHPSILRVSDLCVLGGRVSLVMEYIDGADLSSCIRMPLRPGPRALTEAIAHVADALHVAHHATDPDGRPMDLVHRDIKPGNIRLTKHGAVKLLDFGIAKAKESSRETKTQAHLLLGSVPYMAPEILTFELDEPDPPIDVFALACTFYVSLTGSLFFHDLTPSEQRRTCARRHEYKALVDTRLSRLQMQVPDVAELMREMLAREPADRPTAREVADRLFAIVEDMDGERLRAWCRNNLSGKGSTQRVGEWTGRTITETTMVGRRAVHDHDVLGALRAVGVLPAAPLPPSATPQRASANPAVASMGAAPAPKAPAPAEDGDGQDTWMIRAALLLSGFALLGLALVVVVRWSGLVPEREPDDVTTTMEGAAVVEEPAPEAGDGAEAGLDGTPASDDGSPPSGAEDGNAPETKADGE